ncbi:glycosyltransferase [Neobacillus drentensis]|uniref:glycosyltransferase family 2 protein n=1 Tax=Neobacillus drentensis TaxID=220684 RepID=UPI0030003C8F
MISIICCTIRQHLMENVFKNYESQVWKEKELIILLNKDDMDIVKWEKRAKESSNVTVCQLKEEVTLGESLNFAIDKAKYPFIAKFDDDDYYAPNYLSRSMDALLKTNADVVGKRTIYMYFEEEKILALHKPAKENQFVKQGIKGATLLFKKKICESVRFPSLNLGEDTAFLKECANNRYKVYSADKNNYVCLRTSKPGHHTWNLSNQILLRKSSFVCKTEDYKTFVQD